MVVVADFAPLVQLFVADVVVRLALVAVAVFDGAVVVVGNVAALLWCWPWTWQPKRLRYSHCRCSPRYSRCYWHIGCNCCTSYYCHGSHISAARLGCCGGHLHCCCRTVVAYCCRSPAMKASSCRWHCASAVDCNDHRVVVVVAADVADGSAIVAGNDVDDWYMFWWNDHMFYFGYCYCCCCYSCLV